MEIRSEYFGKTRDGRSVDRYILTDGAYAVSVLTYGGAIQALVVPDKDGRPVDVVLGYDSVEAYETQDSFMGALIGRVGNRISGGRAMVGDTTLTLACNEKGVTHLHGGNVGFDKVIWTAKVLEDVLELSYVSADGEEGYPGELTVTVGYQLKDGALALHYHAESTKDTLCNLTNHAYYNLSGHDSGSIGDQKLYLPAKAVAHMDAFQCPDGESFPVAGTVLDFNEPRAFGEGWDDGLPLMVAAGGYDHHFICDGEGTYLAASVCSPRTGIRMSVYTDLPGLQLYTGNFICETVAGKGNTPYHKRDAFCLETQHVPNAVNCAEFETPLLKAGEVYDHTTSFVFTVE